MPHSSSRPLLTSADVRVHTDDVWRPPGLGETANRWAALAAIAERDLPLAKLVEPHHDAAAILADLGAPPPANDELWAVWAAQPPFAVLDAVSGADGWRLTGRKAFCSGASLVTHALVTAEAEGVSRLFAIDLADGGIGVDGGGPAWSGPGMSRASTVTLEFADVPAVAVGDAGSYVDRVGFWLGAIGIAACWSGGARGVAAPLEAARNLDAHGRAHRGAVRSALATTDLALDAAARRVDQDDITIDQAERLALALRAHVAGVVELVISHVGRALGPGPLAFDAAHAEQVHDLQVFVRQHHAERDLERLGEGSPDA